MLSKIRQGEAGYHYAGESLVRAGARPQHEGEDRSVWLKEALVTIGVRRARHPGKHRYAFRIGWQRSQVRVSLLLYPYPKKTAAA